MIEVITIGVLLYGVLEYFRRVEQTGEELILTTGVAGLPVFAFGAWLVISGVSQGEKGLPLLIFGLLLIPILVMLGLMLRRDAKAYSGVINEDEGNG